MKNLISKIQAFLTDEKGGESVEWVMIVAVLATIIAAASWSVLQDAVSGVIDIIIHCMEGDCSP